MVKPVVLVDLDGVVFDIDTGFHQAFATVQQTKNLPYSAIPVNACTSFFPRAQYVQAYGDDINSIIDDIVYAPGFILNLPLVAGAETGIEKLLSANYDVWFCSAPFENATHSGEKFEAIKNVFGRDMKRRVILTYDKTMIPGTYLIDDHNNLLDKRGATIPSWEQILFRRGLYNKDSPVPKKMSWTDEGWIELLR